MCWALILCPATPLLPPRVQRQLSMHDMTPSSLCAVAAVPLHSHAQCKQQLLLLLPLVPQLEPHVTQVELLLRSNNSSNGA
jgi:hypothetical protein